MHGTPLALGRRAQVPPMHNGGAGPPLRDGPIDCGTHTVVYIDLDLHVGHVRSESQSVQYVPFDIWTSCTQYKHIKIKVHSFKYGISVREKINCKIIDKYLRFKYTL